MGYTALYRKFRPQTFSEMVGQESITRTLKNQIKSNRVGHAYLFNGGRGTGKTTSAKVLARAINCLDPKEGEPCNECEICKAAISGALTDIVEMDAASNNSVEDIRSIREEVNFLPTKAKYRVYIIDEVHMLSQGAFNALLKTLEEPPEHVKFILATTEPQKLPATILSRCQRFDFKRISNEDIVKRLEIVCKESNIQATEQALIIIASLSEGAMRDALSILERCVQDGENSIDEDKVKELVGIPKTEYIHAIVEAITEYTIDKVMETINIVLDEGKDLNNLLWEIIKYIKDILMVKTGQKLSIYNEEDYSKLQQLSGNIEKERAIKLIYELSKLENDMRLSTQRQIIFQAGIIKLCNKEIETQVVTSNNNIESVNIGNNSDLYSRIEKIENYLRSANVVSKGQNTTQKKNVATKSEKPKMNVEAIQGIGKDKKPAQYWNDVVNNFKSNGKIMLYTNLLNTNAVEINDMTVGIEFPEGITSFSKTVLDRPENISEISNQISIACGKEMRIKYIDTKPQQNEMSEEQELLDFANGFDIPFDVLN
ncbi:MAG: DNA polymerase III subunit gamma/tau [Clostridia bacterium]|nr:DNA polymerase III subunit gamma/tau [Clostridia bacterium]